MEYHVYWLLKASCLEIFGDGKYSLFSSQKVDGNMIFINYRKVLVLNFSEMGNKVFFWVKKLTERWYLLITEKFLFWSFRWWEIWYLFQSKIWWKDYIYLVFLSFPWYSTLHKKWSFPLRIYSVNVTKSAVSCGFSHIYWKNP